MENDSGEKMNSQGVKLTILMPVHNEGINLKNMLRILEATVDYPHEVLVVYDRPEDDSRPVVEAMNKVYPHVRPIHNQLGRGVANAIKAGVSHARGEYILVIAADDIGPVLAIDEMIELMEEGCDLVSATRYAHGGRVYGGAKISRILSRTANMLFNFLSGSSLTDATIGIKMIRKSVFDRIVLESRPVGWVIAFELSIKSQLAGLNLGEVPIVSINRFYGGKSSFKPGPWIVEYSKWFLWGLKNIYLSGQWRNRPVLRIPKRILEERIR